jgi:hypothetical protein
MEARSKHILDALLADLHALCAEAKRKSDRLKQVRVCIYLFLNLFSNK